MQGTAADLIKLAMIAVQEALDRERRATRMIMQVHDELVFEVPEAELDWAREAVPRIMAGVASCRCRCSPRSASGRTGTRRTERAAAGVRRGSRRPARTALDSAPAIGCRLRA